MASAVNDSAEREGNTTSEAVGDMDDDDLFEIDLEAVCAVAPPYYWESCFTRTANTLLANCLLPIAEVSSAVPMVVPQASKTNCIFSALPGLPRKIYGIHLFRGFWLATH